MVQEAITGFEEELVTVANLEVALLESEERASTSISSPDADIMSTSVCVDVERDAPGSSVFDIIDPNDGLRKGSQEPSVDPGRARRDDDGCAHVLILSRL